MATGAENDLLQLSLTGELPESVEKAFNEAKQKGNVAFRESRYHEAIEHYTRAENINPMSPIPPANRALVYLKMEKYQSAKDEATMALELYKALAVTQRSNSLAVKILLRRATANKNLMLLTLAADDYQQVLMLENGNPNAEKELKQLNQRHNVRPSLSAQRGSIIGDNRADTKARIRVVEESSKANTKTNGEGNGLGRNPPIRKPRNTELQDETALLQLQQQDLTRLLSTEIKKPPQSPSDFERIWKYLQSSKSSQANYLLHTVGPASIANGVLGESLTPDLFEEIVNVLSIALESEPLLAEQITEVLHALTKVSRFDILRMFFGVHDKQRITTLLNQLQTRNISFQRISTLKELYT